jgi:hypothetical protein
LGTNSSAAAILSVTDNNVPGATIETPVFGSTYTAGSAISFSGSAMDPEDGDLLASAMSWRIDFHHDSHFHPGMPETPGISAGSFAIDAGGETSPNVLYRVYLTVPTRKDSRSAPFAT